MTVEFLQAASSTCFVIAIGFAILAAALFFLLDIWENFLIETDRAQRKTIDEMHERNQATGKLRTDDEKKGNTGKASTNPMTGAGKTLKSKRRGKTDRKPSPADGSDAQDKPASARRSHREEGHLEKNVPHTDGYSETTALADAVRKPGPGFRVIQKTIITHTQESIPL